MLKAKDGREVTIGDWLEDTTGIYEVVRTNVGSGGFTELKEVIFDEVGGYYLSDFERYLTDLEVSYMDRV